MSVIRKGEIFAKQNKLVKVMDIIYNEDPSITEPIIIIREVFLDCGDREIGFEYKKLENPKYLNLTIFLNEYKILVLDEVTLFKIREGLYE